MTYPRINLKYIFVAGAPGSKWSSVVKNIYYSPDIDRSDYKDERTYYHDASGEMQLMHLGAYFDPGMECPLPESMSVLSRKQAEESFNYPFSKNSTGVRIIKSHIFSYYENIQYLKELWPDSPVVLVHRTDDACLGWWVKCGHFDITYPNYAGYYQNLKEMAKIITKQNHGILQSLATYPGVKPKDNRLLCKALNIAEPPAEYTQSYAQSDIKVSVI